MCESCDCETFIAEVFVDIVNSIKYSTSYVFVLVVNVYYLNY